MFSKKLDLCLKKTGLMFKKNWTYVLKKLDLCLKKTGLMFKKNWTYV